MGQVLVFGGKTAKLEHWLWPVTYEDYEYYYLGLTHYIIWIIEYPWDGSTSWIFMVVTFFISPLCGVAQTPDCGMLFICLLYKPFMWCRTDARLWHVCYLFHLWALYVVSLRRPTKACFMLLTFRGVASDTRSVHSISTLWVHIHVSYKQPACMHHGFFFISWLTLWS